MKKALFYGLIIGSVLFSCKSDDDASTTEVEDISTQNTNDDKAIAKYLEEHYLDEQGNIKAFSSTSTDDDNYTKLSDMNPQKLPSGVVVIIREDAQPDNGVEIGESDIIRLMHKTTTFISTESDGEITYSSEGVFYNTISGTGVPQVDPYFYYASTLAENTTRDYYEIEGFREGLKYFKSFDIDDSENYNLQGVIIVPSRAAFARDSHYAYGGISWRNRSFVFNFQVYKTSPRN